MAAGVKPVTLSISLGKKWWQVPDRLWLRRARERERRLKLTLRHYILPLLKEVERLQRHDFPNAPLFLQEKSLEEIERDPIALEVALYMYQAAMSKGLICHQPEKGMSVVSIHRGGALSMPVGSCGMSPNDVVKEYVRVLAAQILKKAGHDPNYLGIYLSPSMQSQVQSLSQLRILCKLNKDIIHEMSKGLGKLDPLIDKHEKWISTLSRANAKRFILPLNQILKEKFPLILDWSEKLLDSYIEHLQSEAQIYALGASIAVISDPGIVKSLASWPIETDESGKTVCRIQHVKDLMGTDLFEKFIQGSPALVKDLGSWPQQKIEVYKPYLGFMTGPALELLNKLDDRQRLAVLAGLVKKFDAGIIRKALKKKEGLLMLRSVVNEIVAMNHNSPQTADKIKKLIAGTYFDDVFNAYMQV